MALHDQSTADLHGDTPSAFSTKGFADRKELASFAFERTRMPMVVVDARAPDQPIVLANSAFLKLTGYTADEVIGRNCRFLQGQGTSPLAIAAIRSAIREEREVTVEILNYRKGGAPFWNQLHTSPLRADDGTVDYIFASQIDVTERRRIERLEASEHRLLKEVDHRAKNVMAIVDSIVRLSNAEDPKRYAAAIQMRVQALAQVHTMLAESGWSAVRLEEVVRQQVAPFAEKRLTVFGPPVMLPSPLVQPLGLVLHELAVNATRHGCLRGAGRYRRHPVGAVAGRVWLRTRMGGGWAAFGVGGAQTRFWVYSCHGDDRDTVEGSRAQDMDRQRIGTALIRSPVRFQYVGWDQMLLGFGSKPGLQDNVAGVTLK